MPTTKQMYEYLKKKYPDHGRKLYLMANGQLWAMYYRLKREEANDKAHAENLMLESALEDERLARQGGRV